MNIEELTIYILREESYIISYDVFTEKDAKHYIQYKKKWEDLYTTKHWKLEDLIGEYWYWDDKVIVSLIEKKITIED